MEMFWFFEEIYLPEKAHKIFSKSWFWFWLLESHQQLYQIGHFFTISAKINNAQSFPIFDDASFTFNFKNF